jgi:hypothetical protein
MSWPQYYGSVIHNSPVYEISQVLKKLKFLLKSVGVILWFWWKSPVRGKNWPELSFSWLWSPDCRSVIHNGPVYEFSQVLKKLKFLLKIRRGLPTVLAKIAIWGPELTETQYLSVVIPILWISYTKSSCIWVLTGFEKTQIFAQNR